MPPWIEVLYIVFEVVCIKGVFEVGRIVGMFGVGCIEGVLEWCVLRDRLQSI